MKNLELRARTLVALALLFVCSATCAERPALTLREEPRSEPASKAKPPQTYDAIEKIPELEGFTLAMPFADCLEKAKSKGFETSESYADGTMTGRGVFLGHPAMIYWSFADGLPRGRLRGMKVRFVEYHEKKALARSAVYQAIKEKLGTPDEITDNPKDDPQVEHETAAWEFKGARITANKEISWPKGQPEPGWDYWIHMETTAPLPLPESPPPADDEIARVKEAREMIVKVAKHMAELSGKEPMILSPEPAKCLQSLLEDEVANVVPTGECVLKGSSAREIDTCLDICRK